MGKIGVDRSEELKNNRRGKRFRKLKTKKHWNKSETVEQGKPMNSQVVREISPEGKWSSKVIAWEKEARRLQGESNWSDEGDKVLGIRLWISEDDEDRWVLIVVDDWIISQHLTVRFQRCFDVSLFSNCVLAGQHSGLVDAFLFLTVWWSIRVFRWVPKFLRKVHSFAVHHRCTSTHYYRIFRLSRIKILQRSLTGAVLRWGRAGGTGASAPRFTCCHPPQIQKLTDRSDWFLRSQNAQKFKFSGTLCLMGRGLAAPAKNPTLALGPSGLVSTGLKV